MTDIRIKASKFVESKKLKYNFLKPKDLKDMLAEFAEQEVAELKKMYHESDEDNNKLRENIPLLAEAKEIIELLLWDLRNRSYELVKDVERAEQFIKNSEEEK